MDNWSDMAEEPNGCTECRGKRGRDWDLCECRGHDGRPDPRINHCNHWRQRWGLAPLQPGDVVCEDYVVRHPASRSCGSCGKKSIFNRAAKLVAATARHIADDLAETPVEALVFRQTQCEGCPLRNGTECTACGCELQKNVLNKGKLRWRSESCPAGMWHRHNKTFRPLVNPKRQMIFHIYPLLGAEWNWHWHIEQIRAHAHLFDRIAIGIGHDRRTASPDAVKSLLEGVPVAEWVIRPNTRKLAETATCVELLAAVKTDDPNVITWRGHCKGVTHPPGSVEQRWARFLWDVCMDVEAVQDALDSHIVAGPMMSHEPLTTRVAGDFFFAGSFYWFRSDVFQRNWSQHNGTRWWIEHWPGAVAKSDEAACLCHDFVKGSVLDAAYFDREVMPDWQRWKVARGRE